MGKNGPVGIKQIAEAAGVAQSTVSVVLNNQGEKLRIAPATQERIMQLAKEMGYKPAHRNKYIKNDAIEPIICVFWPTDFDKGPINEYFNGIRKFFADNKLSYETILIPFEMGKLYEKASRISSGFLSGAVMMALTENDITFLQNNKFDVPIILFNRTAVNYSSVKIDDYDVGQKAMQHFIKRGHRRFGIISPDYSSKALSLRAVGYNDEFQRQNSYSDGAFILPVMRGNNSDEGGFFATQEILKSKQVPSAIFVTNDNMISGVMRCLRINGLKVPGDVEVISYGNQTVNSIIIPNVSSFAPPIGEMSYDCARILHNAIKDGEKLSINRNYVAKCIFRDSCPEIEE